MSRWPSLVYVLVAIAFGLALAMPFVNAAGLVELEVLDFNPGLCGVTDFGCSLLYPGFLPAVVVALAAGALYGVAAAVRVHAAWWRLAMALPLGARSGCWPACCSRAPRPLKRTTGRPQNFIGSFVPIQDWAFVMIQFAGTAATAAFELTVLVVDQVIGYHIVGTEGQKGHAAYRHSWTGTHGLPGRGSRVVAVPARP